MSSSQKDHDKFAVLRIIIIYAFFGGVWIYFSDTVVGWLVHDPVLLTYVAISKGMLFIAITASLLYFLIARYAKRLLKINSMLQEREELLHSVASNTPGVIYRFYSTDAGDFGTNYVSDKAPEIFGLSADAEQFFPAFTARIVSEDRSRFLHSIREAIAAGAPWTFEGRFVKPNGEKLWFHGRSTPHSDKDCLMYNGVLLDITERKRMEEDLRESEEKFSRTFRMSPDTMTISRMSNGVYLDVNDEFSRQMGYAREDAIGKSPLDLGIWVDLSARDRMADLLRTNGEIQEEEYRFRRKDGIIKTGEMSARIVTIGGEPCLLSMVRDISERTEAHRALGESEEKFRSVVERSLVGIAIIDDALRYTYVNEEFCHIAGYSKQEMEGRDFTFPLTQESAGLVAERFQRRQAGEDVPSHYEFSFVQKNGSMRIGEVRSAVYPDSSGKVKTIIQVIDITERKKMEEDKKRLEDQLMRTQKIEAIGTLAGGIAHDFNNLLTGILGNVSLVLMRMEEGDPLRESLKNIEEYVQRGSDLTKQLLGFARGGKYEVVPTDLGEFMKKSSEMFGRTKKEIQIHHRIQTGLWAAEVDRGQMEQVFLNLFVNAWQSMPGGGSLYLSVDNVELGEIDVSPYNLRPGKYVRVTVADTGAGMSEAVKARIFEPFFTTKERDRGTGLGLASVYGIIKNHGGFINVESREGQGSSFMFYLPASDKIPVEDRCLTQADVLTGSETILIIDDESMILDIGTRMLESLNYKVMTAVGGKQGLQIYEKGKDRIDLVILDMIMPDLSGKETFDALLRINRSVRVLLSSGYSLDDQAREIIRRGCKGFIQKPFTMAELSKKIRNSLDLEDETASLSN